MADAVSITLAVAQIVLQLWAAWYAYRAYRLMGASRFWVLVILALVLMTARRVTALAIELEAAPALTGTVAFLDRLVLPSLISLFLLLGLYELHQRLRMKV